MIDSSFIPGTLAGLLLDMPGSRPKEDARAWEIYNAKPRKGNLDGENFDYLVETGEPSTLTLDNIKEAELFNGSLQAVDVTDPESVLCFVNKFGIPSSPLYQGTMRLDWFRHRNDANIRSYVPILTNEINPVNTHLIDLDSPDSLEAELDDCLKGNMPYILSERAREIEMDNPNVVGAISLAEVAQTIRALQMATVLPAAFSYLSRNGGTSEDLIDYLKTPRYVAQAGPAYFLHIDGPIISGGRLDTFERCIERSEQLRDQVACARKRGINVEAGFSIALAEGLWKCANNALRFLSESDYSYRSTAFLWEGDNTDDPNPFARLLGKNRDRLPDFSAHGSIGEAVIEQYLVIFADEKPFRRCENCGRIFKKYREEGFRKNIRETRFCRRSCNVSFNQKSKTN